MANNLAQGAAELRLSNRADLIQALTVASQLEHGLMLMYLYAAFSMKSFTKEFAPAKDPEVLRNKVRDWEARILLVARQEMEHLGFVCNMLTAIGGNQYFDRPNFPAPNQYWPVDLPIELERFDRMSLLRFMAYEKPEKLVDSLMDPLLAELKPPKRKLGAPQPIEVRFTSIGDLYKQIRLAFEFLPDDQLFVVPPASQVNNDTLFGDGSMTKPTYDMFIFKVYDRLSAMNAVDEIIEQGEGTLSNQPVTIDQLDPGCHYMLFRSIFIDYMGGEAKVANPEPYFDAARKCVKNPAWELHQDTITRTEFYGINPPQPEMSVAIITHPWTRDLMGITNTAYESLMQMLIRLYTGADSPNEINGLVQTVFFPMMTMVIRPLSELMSLLPAFKDNAGGFTAGAGFEFFRTIGFLPHKPAAWITIHQRLSENAANFSEALNPVPDDIKKTLSKAGYNPDVALPFIAQNLKRIAMNFQSYMKV
ncbi:MAG: ferritin-like protein [Bacteroidia bacterium]